MIRTINPDDLTVEQQGVIADRVDPGRMIALRPIRIVGPLAFYWAFGKKVRAIRGRAVVTPRVRWIRHASPPIDNQGEPR